MTTFESSEVTHIQRHIERLFTPEQRMLLVELLKRGLEQEVKPCMTE